MVSWWGSVKGGGPKRSLRKRDRGRGRERTGTHDGGMEFWEISGDLGRPLQVLSLPSLQTTTRQRPLLKLTSSYFYNLHTHAHMRNWNMNVWTLKEIYAHWADSYKRAHTRTYTAPSHECGQCKPTIYKTQTLSCNYCFWCMTIAIVWKSVRWNQLSICLWLFSLRSCQTESLIRYVSLHGWLWLFVPCFSAAEKQLPAAFFP